MQKCSREVCTLITSNVIWIKIRLPLFVITCPYTTFLQCCSATLFVATASTFVELTIGNCGANQGGHTCPKHPESIINSCSSVFHFSVSTSESEWNKTDLSSSQCTDVSCCLPAKISRVPHLRIQSCSLEINLAVVLTCLDLDTNRRLVYAFTDFCHFRFRLSRALAFTLRFVRLLVPTIRCSVSILSTVSTLALLSFPP